MTEEEEILFQKLRSKRRKENVYRSVIKWQATHQESRLFYSSKQRARLSGIEHTISTEDVQIPEVCPYIKVPLTNIYRKGRVWTNASLDRIDNTKGYIPGNVQVVSDLANRMKQDATPEQLLTFARSILDLHTPQKPVETPSDEGTL